MVMSDFVYLLPFSNNFRLRQFAGEAFTVIWSMISLHCDLETK